LRRYICGAEFCGADICGDTFAALDFLAQKKYYDPMFFIEIFGS
jgi:hypothetical protein